MAAGTSGGDYAAFAAAFPGATLNALLSGGGAPPPVPHQHKSQQPLPTNITLPARSRDTRNPLTLPRSHALRR